MIKIICMAIKLLDIVAKFDDLPFKRRACAGDITIRVT